MVTIEHRITRTPQTEADRVVLFLAEHGVPAFVDMSTGRTRIRAMETAVHIPTGRVSHDYVTIRPTLRAAREWLGY